MKTEIIATVNQVDLICFTDTENKLIPIKPICRALGLDYDAEVSRIHTELAFSEVIEDFNNGEWEEHGTKAYPMMHALGYAITGQFEDSTVSDKKTFVAYKLECHKAILNFIKTITK